MFQCGKADNAEDYVYCLKAIEEVSEKRSCPNIEDYEYYLEAAKELAAIRYPNIDLSIYEVDISTEPSHFLIVSYDLPGYFGGGGPAFCFNPVTREFVFSYIQQ